MVDTYTYRIAVCNGVDEAALNATGPLQVTAVPIGREATVLTIKADQAGLIGLLRHLHQQGFLLLSVLRDARESE